MPRSSGVSTWRGMSPVHAEMSVSTHGTGGRPGGWLARSNTTSGSPSRLRHLAARAGSPVQVVEIVPPRAFHRRADQRPIRVDATPARVRAGWLDDLDAGHVALEDALRHRRGRLADRLIVTRHLRRYVSDRASQLKRRAENGRRCAMRWAVRYTSARRPAGCGVAHVQSAIVNLQSAIRSCP